MVLLVPKAISLLSFLTSRFSKIHEKSTLFLGDLFTQLFDSGFGSVFGFGILLDQWFDSLELDLNWIPFDSILLLEHGLMLPKLDQILFLSLDELFLFFESFDCFFGRSLLMVTENSDLFISPVVLFNLLIQSHLVKISLVQFILEGDGSIVGSEDFCGQSIHLGFEIVVESAGIDLIEQVVLGLFVFREKVDVFPDQVHHFDSVFVLHRILTQKT